MALPEILRGPQRFDFDELEWKSYLSSIGEYSERVDYEFLRQIAYDHFDQFNSEYPWFDVEIAKFSSESWAAERIARDLRYFNNEQIDFWHAQFDQFMEHEPIEYEIFRSMKRNGTWPFPPIVMRNENGVLNSTHGQTYGVPIHLIEGTHRVSYLNRMLALGMIPSSGKHELVVVNKWGS